MHPAEVATSIDAPSKFAQRTNRGFADATCNLVTGVMLPLERTAILAVPKVRGQSCSATVPQTPAGSRPAQGAAELQIRGVLLRFVERAGFIEAAILPRFHVALRSFKAECRPPRPAFTPFETSACKRHTLAVKRTTGASGMRVPVIGTGIAKLFYVSPFIEMTRRSHLAAATKRQTAIPP
jgi:hypothetical protein